MPDYRRCYLEGGTFFFTIVTYNRWWLFEDRRARTLLGSVLRSVARERPFKTVAIVLLWDHLHCVWTLPMGDTDYSARMREIKGRFSESWLGSGGYEQPVTPAQRERGHRGVWQLRFWEHRVRDEDDLERCCDYIHYNPVKHGYVTQPSAWPWSSFHRFVQEGQYPENWGRTMPEAIRGWEWE